MKCNWDRLQHPPHDLAKEKKWTKTNFAFICENISVILFKKKIEKKIFSGKSALNLSNLMLIKHLFY